MGVICDGCLRPQQKAPPCAGGEHYCTSPCHFVATKRNLVRRPFSVSTAGPTRKSISPFRSSLCAILEWRALHARPSAPASLTSLRNRISPADNFISQPWCEQEKQGLAPKKRRRRLVGLQFSAARLVVWDSREWRRVEPLPSSAPQTTQGEHGRKVPLSCS
jgi:hypothetical protein